MTRNSDLDLEDLVACDHSPETPVTNDDGVIVKWLCRCGREVPAPKNDDMPSDTAFRAIIRSAKDSLSLATSEEDVRLAIAKRTWRMALTYANERGRTKKESETV